MPGTNLRHGLQPGPSPRQSKGFGCIKGKMADPPARAATGANGVIVAGDGDDRGRRSGPASPDYGNQIEEACPGLAARAVHSCLDRLTAGDELVINTVVAALSCCP